MEEENEKYDVTILWHTSLSSMTKWMLVTIDVQYTHSMGTNTNEAHWQCKFAVFHIGETFCKNVGYLISCWDIFKFDILTGNTIPNKMMSNLNVLGPAEGCFLELHAMAPPAILNT